jgi:hypothetical protein
MVYFQTKHPILVYFEMPWNVKVWYLFNNLVNFVALCFILFGIHLYVVVICYIFHILFYCIEKTLFGIGYAAHEGVVK